MNRVCRWALVFAVAGTALAPPAWAVGQLTLDDAIARALRVSPQVGMARQNLVEARARSLTATSGWIPDLRASTYLGHRWTGPTSTGFVDEQGRFVTGPANDFPSYSFGISSGWRLWDWGATWYNRRSAVEETRASSHDLEYQRDVVRAAVIREYYELVRQRRLIAVREADVEAQQRNLDQVEAFYRIGSRTRADVLQARVNLANSRLQLLQARNAEALAAARLKSRLDIPQDEPVEIDESLDIDFVSVDVDSIVAVMEQHRSDLLAARRRVAAAGAQLAASEKGWLPTIDVGFGYSWNDRQVPDHLGGVFRRDYAWSLGLSLQWPIFDRYATRSRIDQARAQYRIARYRLQQARLDAILDVRQIAVNLEQARERVALAEETVEQARENLRLAEERYRVGAGTVLETLQASASLTNAQAQLIEARIDYLVNRADLQRATGAPVTVAGR